MNLNQDSPHSFQPAQPKVPEHLAAGGYASAMITSHTREEFVLDFIAGFIQPSRVVARVILNPAHVKRLAAAIRSNLEMYERNVGALPESPKPPAEPLRSAPAQDFYSQLTVPDQVLMGCYANSVVINHTREEFILNFIASFPPTPVLAARVLVSPAHMRRIVRVLEARLRMYENAFGALPGPSASPEPPPESGSRFSLS